LDGQNGGGLIAYPPESNTLVQLIKTLQYFSINVSYQIGHENNNINITFPVSIKRTETSQATTERGRNPTTIKEN
jgi:hypothetical protein